VVPIKPPRDGEVTPFCNHLAFEGAGYGLSSAISHHCSVAFFFRPSLEEAPVISWANVFAAKIWIQGHSFWVDSRRRFFWGGLVSKCFKSGDGEVNITKCDHFNIQA